MLNVYMRVLFLFFSLHVTNWPVSYSFHDQIAVALLMWITLCSLIVRYFTILARSHTFR